MIYLGYDYGTTNSMVSLYEGGESSSVSILARRTTIVTDGNREVRSPKRLLSKLPAEERRATRYLEDFSRSFLSDALRCADWHHGVRLAVTVPNAFKDAQCKIMLDTIRGVGFDLFGEEVFNNSSLTIIPEPIAAALYYVYMQQNLTEGSKLLCICDIGGGTTDLAIVRYIVAGEPGHRKISFKVLCTEGDDNLGGDDIDRIIAEDIVSRYQLSPRMYSEKTLLACCQGLKRQLSFETGKPAQAVLTSPDGETPAYYPDGGMVVLELTRNRLEMLLERHFLPRFAASLKRLKESFKKQLLGKGLADGLNRCLEESTILPIGGTSQVPYLRKIMSESLLGKMFLMKGEVADANGNAPFDSVVRGAAVYSACENHDLAGVDSIVVEGRTLHRLSLRVNGNELETIVEKNMPSQIYKVDRPLFPLRADPDGTTFRLQSIELYEGEGLTIDDNTFGTCPVPLVSQSDVLRHLDDHIYTHDRPLKSIPIDISFDISQGRLESIEVCVPLGMENKTDYHKTIQFVV